MAAPVPSLSVGDPDEAAWSMLVAGDATDRGDPSAFSVSGPLAARIEAADLSLVNVEAPVRAGADPAPKSGPTLESSPALPAFLAGTGFDAATLANNHVMDYGATGLAATLDACRDADLATCGAGDDHEAALAPLERTVDGTDVAVINVCEREFGIAGADASGAAWLNHPSVDDRIRDAAAANDAVVVVAHGGVEGVPFSPPGRRARFREFVDLGADAVIGHHPHVPQGWETYDGSPIVYSLGNFLFEMSNPSTRWGLAVELGFDGGTVVGADLLPVELVDGTLHPLGVGRSRNDHLSHLRRLAEITGDDDAHAAYWQETAERVFLARLGDALRGATGGTLLSALDDPGRYVRTDRTWDERKHRDEMLVLLNLTRNESLRAVIRTALELRTGTVEDSRTPAVRAEARQLLERTAEEPLYDRPHRARALAGALLSKFQREGSHVARTFRGHLSAFR